MKILVVEDEKNLAQTIKQCICTDYEVELAYDGYEGYMLAKNSIYDVIILDLMLPEMSGYEVLKNLRDENVNTPVLILSAKDGIGDKVKGFNYGADDYMVKPFAREELLARLEAILRRSNKLYKNDVLKFKDLELNIKNKQVKINGEIIPLYGKQIDILEFLLNSKDTIITKEQIFDKIWGFNSDTTTNVVEVYASGLRKSLKKYGYDKYIKTVRGVGYIISENDN